MILFADYFIGYNPIRVNPELDGKTTFITPWETSYYTIVTFGLKNEGVAYKKPQLLHNMIENVMIEAPLEPHVFVFLQFHRDILYTILSFFAKNSSQDLMAVKGTCKQMRKLGDSRFVLQNIPIFDYLLPTKWLYVDGQMSSISYLYTRVLQEKSSRCRVHIHCYVPFA